MPRYTVRNLVTGATGADEAPSLAQAFGGRFPNPRYGHPERRIPLRDAIGEGNTLERVDPLDPHTWVVVIPAEPERTVTDPMSGEERTIPAREEIRRPLSEQRPAFFVRTHDGELLPSYNKATDEIVLPAWHVVTVEQESDPAYAAELRERRRERRESRIERWALRKLMKSAQRKRDAGKATPEEADIARAADRLDADRDPEEP